MSTPEGWKQPQDHLPKATEAPDTVPITYGGETYALPGSLDDLDGNVIDAIDDGKVSYVLRNMLGTEQWKKFKATKPKVRAYVELFDAWAEAVGLESSGE